MVLSDFIVVEPVLPITKNMEVVYFEEATLKFPNGPRNETIYLLPSSYEVRQKKPLPCSTLQVESFLCYKVRRGIAD